MAHKSVSLFEILPPSGKDKNPKESHSSNENLNTERSTEPQRKIVSDSVAAEHRKETGHKTFTAPTTHSSLKSHSVEGVSVRKKEDHFALIVACMLVLSAVTFLVGYRFGQRSGIKEATQQFQASAPHSRSNIAEKSPPSEIHQTPNSAEILPTALRSLTQEQVQVVTPPAAPKYFTLQVQTLGRNQKTNIDDLLNNLQTAGFEAFADYSDGAVFVGRLESTRGREAEQLKDSVSRFNWRQRDFSSAYFRRIPNRLLDN